MKLTEKQQRFVDYYIVTGNAAEAARKAGYSPKVANRIGAENMSKPVINKAIYQRLEELKSERTADVTEVMEHLTAAMRGEIVEEVVAVEGTGEGCSSAVIVKKQIGAKDRLKAAELLLKRYPMKLVVEEQQLRNAKLKAEVAAMQDTENESVVIVDDVPDEG